MFPMNCVIHWSGFYLLKILRDDLDTHSGCLPIFKGQFKTFLRHLIPTFLEFKTCMHDE